MPIGATVTAGLATQLEKERHTVSFDSYDITVKQLLDMIESRAIDIAPDYQRQFIWDEKRQSLFVESVLLGIPIPSLFMATNKDSTWELVDGVQRISTLINFCGTDDMRRRINSKQALCLCDLEKLTTFNACEYTSLPKSIQLAFLLRPIRVTTLNDKSDLRVRFDLFERLNTGGVRLQPQEIRNCIFRGPFNEALKELTRDSSFRKVVKVKTGSENNGTREEFVLRFLAFYDGYQTFDHSVDGFLNAYMGDRYNHPPASDRMRAFAETFAFLKTALPNGIVRFGRHSLTPVNLYEAVAVGTALALKTKARLKGNVLVALLDSDELTALTSAGTNSRKMVKGRIELVRDRLVG